MACTLRHSKEGKKLSSGSHCLPIRIKAIQVRGAQMNDQETEKKQQRKSNSTKKTREEINGAG